MMESTMNGTLMLKSNKNIGDLVDMGGGLRFWKLSFD